MKFRKCSSFDTLEKVFERLCEKNAGIALMNPLMIFIKIIKLR
nr:Hha/YmoA family nucleoid-associated regulatory protein [Escherichia coli]